MKYYGLLFHEYWDGATGSEIGRRGGVDALLVGAFLTSNRADNMCGLYRLPLTAIQLPLTTRRLVAALATLHRTEFASYDYDSEYVWVREMARFRLGLHHRNDALDRQDKRVLYVQRWYDRLADNPFLEPFYTRYCRAFHMVAARVSAKPGNIIGNGSLPLEQHRKPLASPLQAPYKPLQSVHKPLTENSPPIPSETVEDVSSGGGTSTGDVRTNQKSVIQRSVRSRPVENSEPLANAPAGGELVNGPALLEATIRELKTKLPRKPARR